MYVQKLLMSENLFCQSCIPCGSSLNHGMMPGGSKLRAEAMGRDGGWYLYITNLIGHCLLAFGFKHLATFQIKMGPRITNTLTASSVLRALMHLLTARQLCVTTNAAAAFPNPWQPKARIRRHLDHLDPTNLEC